MVCNDDVIEYMRGRRDGRVFDVRDRERALREKVRKILDACCVFGSA